MTSLAREPLPVPRALRGIPALILALVFAAPLAALVLKGLPRCGEGLVSELLVTVLPMQLFYSLVTALGAVLVGAALGCAGALCGLFDFPGRRALEGGLLAPLLVPAWFLAVLYQHRLGAAGAVPLALVLGIASAPLFQLFVSAALRNVPVQYGELLVQLGRGAPLPLVRHLAPLVLPAFVAAAILAFLLAWGDAATARVLAVPTLTVGLYDHWFGRQEDSAGAPIAVALLVLSLLPALAAWSLLKRWSFRDRTRLQRRGIERARLAGPAALVPWLLAAPLLCFGVLYPGWVIVAWTAERVDRVSLSTLGGDLARTLALAVAATIVAASLALLLVRDRVAVRAPYLTAVTARVVVASFAIPPVVLALAFLWLLPERDGSVLFAWLNSTPLPLTAALALRFCAVFFVAGEAALLRSARAHCDLVRVCGRVDIFSFLRSFRPFLTTPLAAGACFVFLEALKDLSLSLLLQPFGFTTVAARVFQYAQTQRVPECSVWVACLALAGIYPLWKMARIVDSAQGGASASSGRGAC